MDVREFMENGSFEPDDTANEEKEVAKQAIETLTSADLGSYVQSIGPTKTRDMVKDIIDADDVDELELTKQEYELT